MHVAKTCECRGLHRTTQSSLCPPSPKWQTCSLRGAGREELGGLQGGETGATGHQPQPRSPPVSSRHWSSDFRGPQSTRASLSMRSSSRRPGRARARGPLHLGDLPRCSKDTNGGVFLEERHALSFQGKAGVRMAEQALLRMTMFLPGSPAARSPCRCAADIGIIGFGRRREPHASLHLRLRSLGTIAMRAAPARQTPVD